MLVEGLDDPQGFEGVSSETTDFEAHHLVDVVALDIPDKVHNLRPFFYALGSADLVAKHRLNTPTNAPAIVGQFVYLPLVFLLIRAHSSQNHDLIHNGY